VDATIAALNLDADSNSGHVEGTVTGCTSHLTKAGRPDKAGVGQPAEVKAAGGLGKYEIHLDE
jgi:hypothetical protein